MSEVHRYQVVTMLSASGATIGYDPHGPDVVMASAFDEATRMFLDAAERCVASERREKELQQRLTAADERADVLEGLLSNAYETAAKWVEKRCDAYVDEHGSRDPETGTVEFPGDGEEYVGELMEIADGLRALKP